MISAGYNALWTFSMQGSAAVQELLSRSDLKLEDLLDEEGLSLELKTQNQKLFDFLCKDENFKKLISYAVAEPDLDEMIFDQKRYYKYPFVCAEILGSETPAVINTFFKTKKDNNDKDKSTEASDHSADDEVNVEEVIEKENLNSPEKTLEKELSFSELDSTYLDYLFDFLDQKVMNLTSAGYLAKIINNLYLKRTISLTIYIYEKRPIILERLVNHIYSKSLTEILVKILTFEPYVILKRNEEIYNTLREKTLKQVLEKLKPECDIEEINNSAFLICEVFGKYGTMHNSHAILKTILDKDTIDGFFKLLRGENTTSTCAAALILGNIFAYYILINTPRAGQTSHSTSEEGATSESPATQPMNQNFEVSSDLPLIVSYLENLDGIVDYLANRSGTEIKSQYGASVVPFGAARLKLIELVIITLKANNPDIARKLTESRLLEILLDLMIKYEWNNMLHNQVEKLVSLILDSGPQELKKALFEKANLVNFLVSHATDKEFQMPGYRAKHGRKTRKGYLGQLYKIANKLAESNDPIVQQFTSDNERWKEFKNTVLAETNQQYKFNLGGRDPRAPLQPEESDMKDTQMELPSFLKKFTHFFTVKKPSVEFDKDEVYRPIEDEVKGDDDDEDDEDKNKDFEDAINKEESLDSVKEQKHIKFVQEDDESHNDSLSGAIPDSSTPVRGRNSFGFIHRIEPKDQQDEIDEDDNCIWFSEPSSTSNVDESNDHELEKAEFFANQYWKTDSWHTPEDILTELGIL